MPELFLPICLGYLDFEFTTGAFQIMKNPAEGSRFQGGTPGEMAIL
jgi:hypothetical protein